MTHTRAFTAALALASAALFAAEPQQQPPAGAQTQQPSTVRTTIGDLTGGPPRLAVPEFIPLSSDADVVAAAKTIGEVLWDDLAYEKEFYMLPRDILRTVPRPPSADQVALNRWKELQADGVVVGTVAKTADSIIVEARLLKVSDGSMALGKKYSGSLRSLADGGRVFAHSFADEVHQTQRNLRGVAMTKLAFSSDRAGGRMKGPVGDRAISNIYRADYDGANQTQMTFGRTLDLAPAWDPTGATLLYFTYRGGYPDLVLQSLKNANAPTFPARGNSAIHNFLPVWSHDGSKIAFMSNRDGNPEIYVINRDGSNVRRITNHPMADTTPTWSPSGNQLAFTSDRSGTPQIYVVNLDGTGLVRISQESFCDRATWSAPPRNEIAYASRSGGGYEIRLFDFETRQSTVITDGIGSNESPAFAPNGRHLAFTSDRTGTPQIYTIARDGTGLRQITKAGSNRYPTWSQ
jgi:TolB protein